MLTDLFVELYTSFGVREQPPTLGIEGYITLTFTMKYHPFIISISSHISP